MNFVLRKASEYDGKILQSHTLQTYPRHREEEPQNNKKQKTAVEQTELSNQLSLPIKMIAKLERTQRTACLYMYE